MAKNDAEEKKKALAFIKKFHQLVEDGTAKMNIQHDHAVARRHMAKVRELAEELDDYNLGFDAATVVVDTLGRFVGLMDDVNEFRAGDLLEVITRLKLDDSAESVNYIIPLPTDYPVFTRTEGHVLFFGGVGILVKRLGGEK